MTAPAATAAGLGPAARRLLVILDDYRNRPVVVTDAPRARRQLYAMDKGASERWLSLPNGSFNRATLDELTGLDLISLVDLPREQLPRALDLTIRATAVRTVLALRTAQTITLRNPNPHQHPLAPAAPASTEDPS